LSHGISRVFFSCGLDKEEEEEEEEEEENSP